MRIPLSFLAALALVPGASSATTATYVIDPAQSYVAVEVPTWERGDPWMTSIEAWPDGTQTMTVLEYSWLPSWRMERFAISGSLNVVEVPASDEVTQLQFETLSMLSSAPPELGFQMVPSVFLDATDAITSLPAGSCSTNVGEFAVLCLMIRLDEPYPARVTSVTRTVDTLRLEGTSGGYPNIRIWPIVFGGLEPPEMEYSLADLGYTYHIVASVPEPSVALLMLPGLMLLMWRRRPHGHEACLVVTVQNAGALR